MPFSPMNYLTIRERYKALWRERYSETLLKKPRPQMMAAYHRIRGIEKHLKRLDLMMTDQEFLTVYQWGRAA